MALRLSTNSHPSTVGTNNLKRRTNHVGVTTSDYPEHTPCAASDTTVIASPANDASSSATTCTIFDFSRTMRCFAGSIHWPAQSPSGGYPGNSATASSPRTCATRPSIRPLGECPGRRTAPPSPWVSVRAARRATRCRRRAAQHRQHRENNARLSAPAPARVTNFTSTQNARKIERSAIGDARRCVVRSGACPGVELQHRIFEIFARRHAPVPAVRADRKRLPALRNSAQEPRLSRHWRTSPRKAEKIPPRRSSAACRR